MRKQIRINILELRHNKLYLAGVVYNYNSKKERFYISDSRGNEFSLQFVRAAAMDRLARETGKELKGYCYEICLPLLPGCRYSFYCDSKGEQTKLEPIYGNYSRLTEYEHSYFRQSGLLIAAEDNSICIFTDSVIHRLPLTRKYNKSLSANLPDEALELRRKAIAVKEQSKPIWLISDRTDAANDNGEALFSYLMGTEAPEKYDIRFIIDKNSPDYERMKDIGPVIPAGSEEHLIMYIAASLMISSSADEWVRNPLWGERKYYRDILEGSFVFLQHGVIKHDLSGWLYLLKKNIRLFICSSKEEWESIAHGNYGYNEDTVKLTGLARYDKLCNDPHKTIAILPTWRNSIAPTLQPGTSDRPYTEEFRNTDYFNFYNRLINDPDLIRAMKDHGYTGTFYLHPNHRNQWVDFDGNDTIGVWNDLITFSKVFNENALLVTDYSSVAIDFAYLRKPVIYAQPDIDDFYADQPYDKGYFDYEREGFGPVCYSYEKTVASMIEFIENDCLEPDSYRDRVDKFFAFGDRNNSQRIYQELLKLME